MPRTSTLLNDNGHYVQQPALFFWCRPLRPTSVDFFIFPCRNFWGPRDCELDQSSIKSTCLHHLGPLSGRFSSAPPPRPMFSASHLLPLKKYSSISTCITNHLSFQVTKRVNLFRLNFSLWDGIDSVLGGTWWTLAQLNSQWAIKRPEMTAIGFW